MPARISSSWRLDSDPTSSVSNSRSTVMIWDTLATESLGRPVARAGSKTLPGASAQPRLRVSGTHTIVRMRLRLSVSPWTTTTGLRKPGPEPVGSGKSAQYTWPWVITIPRFEASGLPPLKRLDLIEYRSPRIRGSSPRLRLQGRGAPRIRSRLPCRLGSVIFSGDGITAPHHDRSCRGSRSLFSYPKYIEGHFPAQPNAVGAANHVDKILRAMIDSGKSRQEPFARLYRAQDVISEAAVRRTDDADSDFEPNH